MVKNESTRGISSVILTYQIELKQRFGGIRIEKPWFRLGGGSLPLQ